MKKVNLVKLQSESVMIGDLTDRIDCERLDMRCKPKQIERTSEFLHPQFSVSENVIINRISDHGVNHYIAVTRDVWEYMALIENPVTVKSLQEERASLKGDIYNFHFEIKDLNNTLNCQNSELKSIKSAAILTRVKWLFTGVN